MTSYTTGTTTLFGGRGDEEEVYSRSEIDEVRQETRGLAEVVFEREQREAARHDQLMGKLEQLIDLYANVPLVTAKQLSHRSSSSSEPTVISVSPIRATRQRDISPPRHYITAPPLKKPTKKPKKKRYQKDLLAEIEYLERYRIALEADGVGLRRENDLLAVENLQYRSRLQDTDKALNKMRKLQTQVRTLSALQGKGSDINKKNSKTLGKVKQSVSSLTRAWRPTSPPPLRLTAPPQRTVAF